MKRLERFIEGHRKEGALLEQGDFTLCPEEALRKIASFGLESPEKALLRLVQLAVADGCSLVRIGIGRAHVSLRFESVPGLGARVKNLAQEVNLDANNLGLALLASLHSGFSGGSISFGNTGWRFQRSGFEAVAEGKFERSQDVLLELRREATAGFWNRLKALLKRRCLDYTTLRGKLRHCPSAVVLDGMNVPVDRRPTKKLLLEVQLTGGPEWSGAGCLQLETRPHRFTLNRSCSKVMGPWRTYAVHLGTGDPKCFGERSEVQHDEEPASVVLAHLWIPFGKGIGGVALVADGVEVGKIRLDFPLPVYGFVSAAGLDRDLSGLEVATNEKLKNLKEQLSNLLWHQLTRLAPRADLKNVKTLLKRAGVIKSSEKTRRKKTKWDTLFLHQDPLPPESESTKRKKKRSRRGSDQDKLFKQSRADFNVQRRSLRDRGRFK